MKNLKIYVQKICPNHDLNIIFMFMLSILIPGWITLSGISKSSETFTPILGTSPFGYTWSLSFFIIPVLFASYFFLKHPRVELEKKAFFVASAIIFALGCVLDFIFGYSFFQFPNPESTLQIRLPSLSFSEGWVSSYLPIEEFGFYIFGGFFMLSVYAFGDNFWFSRYNTDEYTQNKKSLFKMIDFHTPSLIWGGLAIIIAFLYKKFGPHDFQEGIPGYFIFEICLAILPSIMFFKSVKNFINYRAFSFMYISLLFISVIWEATLGVPLGWWGYKFDQMIGIIIYPWGWLPIEAIILWFTAGWGATIVFEVMKLHYYSRRS